MGPALIALILILLILGGGGFVWNVLWYLLIAAVVLWLIRFLVQGAEGGRWYRF